MVMNNQIIIMILYKQCCAEMTKHLSVKARIYLIVLIKLYSRGIA